MMATAANARRHRWATPATLLVVAAFLAAVGCGAGSEVQGAAGSTAVTTTGATPAPGTTAVPFDPVRPATAAQLRVALTLAFGDQVALDAQTAMADQGGRPAEAAALDRPRRDAHTRVDDLLAHAGVAATRSQPVSDASAAVDAAVRAGDPGATAAAVQAGFERGAQVAAEVSTEAATARPQQFPGDPGAPGADLQTALHAVLQQHVALASMATGSALGGRSGEFDAFKAALDANSATLAAAMTDVFGAATGTPFARTWGKHIGFFVDYATALGTTDAARKQQATADLQAYPAELAKFFHAALPSLPESVLADLISAHIVGLEGVMDAQAASDPAAAIGREQEAAAHMAMIAEPLAGAVAARFPERYGS